MTKKNTFRLLPMMIFCLLLSVAQILAQASGRGNISGTVTDSNGALVPNATVNLTNKGTNEGKTTNTNADGFYQFVDLQPGTYTVKTTAGSFAAVTLEVGVFVGRTTDANVILGAKGVNEVVQVTAEGIQSSSSNFDAVTDASQITNLPINGRRFQDLALGTPTAQVDNSRGQISLSGQRGINSNVSVDGMDYNQPFFGGIRGGERSNSAPTLPQESVREFQVVANNFSSEFGRSSGGIVNVVTKSGTNEVHGSLFYVLRPKELSRDNPYTLALKEQKLTPLGISPVIAPTQQQWGGSIGGPIKHDRAFYFGSLEMQRFRAPRQVIFTNLPSAASVTARQSDAFNFYNGLQTGYNATNDAILGLGKVDFDVSAHNHLSARFNMSRNKALNAVSVGETSPDPTTANSLSTNGTEMDRTYNVVAQLNSTFSSNIFNEARFQFAREVRPRIPNTIIANVNTAMGVYGTRNFLPTTQFDTRWQGGDNLSIIHGNHTIKVGGEFSRLFASQIFGFNQTGVYTFSGIATSAILDNMSPTSIPASNYYGRFDTTLSRYNQQVGNLTAAYAVREISAYGQDSWRVNNKLTLNFGFRWERQLNPAAQANNTPVLNAVRAAMFPIFGSTVEPATIPNSQNEWGPQAGFAWDPKGDGKTVIRGHAGEYYARTPLIILAAPFNNFRDPAGDLSVTLGSVAFAGTAPTATTASNFNFPAFFAANTQYATITGLTAAQCATAGNAGQAALFATCAPNSVFRQFAIIGINLNTFNLSGLPTLSSTQVAQITAAMNNAISPTPTGFGIYQGANFTGITSNYRNPQSFQFSLGIEHEFFKDFTVGFDFSQVNTANLQRNRDINLPAPTGVDAATGRVLVNRASRPLTSFGQIQLRDSSAFSRYYAYTARVNWNSKWARIGAFYTFSHSYSDDDNERDAGGVLYDNPYNLALEYYNANLDRRHQFVAYPVFFLPYGIEFASTIALRAGRPVNALISGTGSTDVNGDGNSNERPIVVPGVELPRNFFTNKPLYDVSVRAQKGFKMGETRRLVLSVEFFNVLNRANIQYAGSTVTNYCRSSVEQPGQAAAPATNLCGLSGVTNSTFLQILDQRQIVNGAANPAFGKINLSNTLGSQVFQTQIGARFYF